MPLMQLSDYFVNKVSTSVSASAVQNDINNYSTYVIGMAGSPENSRVVMILRKVIANATYGTPIAITDAELAATSDDLTSFSNWISNVLHGDPLQSHSVQAIKQVLASSGMAPTGNTAPSSNTGTTPGNTGFGPPPYTPPSFIETNGKYIAGGLAVLGVLYFKFFRKKAV